MNSTPVRRRRRAIETADYLAMLARMLHSGGKRVGNDNVEDLVDLISLREELDRAIVEAVRGFRRAGHTWEEIGAATGTTRQAAIMKWSKWCK